MGWLLLYFLILLAVSLKGYHKNITPQEFYICGRHSSTFSVAFSILASSIGGSIIIGISGLAWNAGWPAIWWLGSGSIGVFFFGLLLVKKVRKTGAYTMPDVIQAYLGYECRIICAVIILFAWLAIIGAQLNAMGQIVSAFLSLDFYISVIIGALILLCYTLLGGQQSIVKSDFWQFIFMTISLFIMFFIISIKFDALGNIRRCPFEIYNAEFPLSQIAYYLLIIGGSYLIAPTIFSRLLCARNSKIAKRGVFYAIFGLIFFTIFITSLGLSLRGLIPPSATPNEALTRAIEILLPPWAKILVLLGLLSAILSATDTSLLTASTVATGLIAKKYSVEICRYSMIGLTCAGSFLALSGKTIINLLLAANDIFVCGIAAPMFIAMVLEKRKKNTTIMALGIILGGACGICSAIYQTRVMSFAGVATSALLSLMAYYVFSRCKNAYNL